MAMYTECMFVIQTTSKWDSLNEIHITIWKFIPTLIMVVIIDF